MNQMDDNFDTEAGQEFLALVSRIITIQERVRRTIEAEEARFARNDLAESIVNAIENAESLEDLIHYEMILQTLDRLSARSQQDINSVENAQRQYRQLINTISQMRRNPDEYLQANIGFRETDGDIRKLPRGRIQQIHSNITRLRNRAAFVSEEECEVWNSRIKLAEKTIEMLRALHKRLVKEYEDKTDPK